MRLSYYRAIILCSLGLGFTASAEPPKSAQDDAPKQVQVNADQSLEYYEDKRLYVARGNAKAVRGTLTVTGDTLTAHERDKPAPGTPKPKPPPGTKNGEAGDIDLMTADGNVVITDPKQRITGDHAVYDLDKHTMIVTGHNLRYETAKEVVTARDSLEYYEDTKLAVARGNAVADQPDRHVEGDILTAEFRDAPNGQSQLTKMTAQGHVTVLTKTKDSDTKGSDNQNGQNGDGSKKNSTAKKGGDVSRGDRAVYDASSNVAVLTGDVHVTRGDGTELSGDVGEVDFNNNQSRLMDDGNTRVRALLPPKTTDAAANKGTPPAAQPAPQPVTTP